MGNERRPTGEGFEAFPVMFPEAGVIDKKWRTEMERLTPVVSKDLLQVPERKTPSPDSPARMVGTPSTPTWSRSNTFSPMYSDEDTIVITKPDSESSLLREFGTGKPNFGMEPTDL